MEKELLCENDAVHEETVEAVRKQMCDEDEYARVAALLKIFGDPTRVKLLHALEQRELCVCDLAALLGVTKSAVSHQLKLLRVANLVRARREGQSVYYSPADDHVSLLLNTGFEHVRE